MVFVLKPGSHVILACLLASLFLGGVARAQSPIGQADANDNIENSDFSKAKDAALRRSPHRKLLARVYRELSGGPLFFRGGRPTQKASTLVEGVHALKVHGVNRGPYRLGYADESYQKSKKVSRKRRRARKREPKPFELVASDDPVRLAKQDVRLLHALVQYVLDFRILRPTHPHRPTRNLSKARDHHSDVIVATVRKLLLADSLNLESLWPQSPVYRVLLGAHSRYERLGLLQKDKTRRLPRLNWRKWKWAARKKKFSSDLVRSLQVRLAGEGYYDGEAHGEFDLATTEALQKARVTYSLPPEGGVDYHFAIRANVSTSRRIAAIKVSLQRLRESASLRRGLSTYIRINIPTFELELIEQGIVTRRHRVIVGNNRLDFNRYDWKQGYLNRTPLLETRIKQVIINPRWRPPPRIRDEEFEGAENVLVEPGPKNPLGYVKFTLERTSAVFMHDTNKRKKFDKIVRAYSHGCIRVHDAMGLAEHVVLNYTSAERGTFEAARDGKQTRPFAVERDVPVFVEYLTVGLDAEGRLRFAPDIYRYDRAWLRGKTPVSKVRFGSSIMRPKSVPLIPKVDYQRLKAAGGKAPMQWPPVSAAVTPIEDGVDTAPTVVPSVD
jgi:hypothetical protein